MPKQDYSKEKCISMLRAVQERIHGCGETRYPKKSDFTNEEIVAIKAFLGPWPRALEAAGLKPVRSFDRIEYNRDKRRRAKRHRRELAEAKKSCIRQTNDNYAESPVGHPDDDMSKTDGHAASEDDIISNDIKI